MEIKYDPAIAANVISVVAMIVAAMSYRLTKKAELNKKEATLPEVTTTLTGTTNQPGWHQVTLTIRNHLPTDLYATQVRLRRPSPAVGLNSDQASEASPSGDRQLFARLPAEDARTTIQLGHHIGPHGATPHQYGLHPGDKAWITFYVRAEPSIFSKDLVFDVEFAVRKTDIRRRDRHVSHQKIRLPQ